jgi:Fe-S oxidoreductase
MCPSFKASGDLALSPKGRAEALRKWRRQEAGEEARDPRLADDLYASLDACLSCKACAGSCPAHVDIPEMKSHFLENYHSERRRPLGDSVVLLMERATELLVFLRHPARLAQRLGANQVIARMSALSGLPVLSARSMAELGFLLTSWKDASRGTWSSQTVFVVQDVFNALFDTDTVAAICSGLARLGYEPVLLPALPGGKAAHVKGARRSFLAQANRMRLHLRGLARAGRPIVATDAAFVTMLRNEYVKAGLDDLPAVVLVEEFLAARAKAGDVWPQISGQPSQRIFLHCTEAASKPTAGSEWAGVFGRLGITVEIVQSGCCGMSGLFGHEKRNIETSKRLFDLSWRKPVEASAEVYATGFSCRCQVERLSGRSARHPMHMIVQGFSPSSGYGVRKQSALS